MNIGVVGLGYVGLPLAVAFGQHFPTIGFDLSKPRIEALKRGQDHTKETQPEELAESVHLRFTDNVADLADCNIYIIAVPTPVDQYKKPDLTLLESASRMVGELLSVGDIAVFESTVFPGATEDICAPILEQASGLICDKDFFLGYSPERINPGDKEHRLTDIVKVVSGSTPETTATLKTIYGRIIRAGIFPAASIKTAEAAKVIENVQRDVNIALINELAMLFNRIGVDSQDVLDAAQTKWNFLPFKPGLVGGHCIGVDPYYLTYKAQGVGFHPEIILSGRRINDQMGFYIGSQVIQRMSAKGARPKGAKALVMGLTFKENCPDLRNTRVVDVVEELEKFGVQVEIHDPIADPEEAERELGVKLIKELIPGRYDAIVIAVSHAPYKQMTAEAFRALGNETCVLYDVKHILPADQVDGRL